MSDDVLVFQPGLQHSHQLAWALQERQRLRAFWSGVPVRTRDQARPLWWPAATWARAKQTSLLPERHRTHAGWWLAMKAATSLGSTAKRFVNMHRVLHGIDRAMASRVARAGAAVVVGYENACLHSFKAAKARGSLCVLDAASFHYARGNRLLPSPAPGFQPAIDAWKQQEIELADAIICCSDLARESYLEAGVTPDKVFALALGASLPAADFAGLAPAPNGPVRFAFAGAMHTRKSIDLVLQCFANLHQHQPGQAELHIYGGSDSPQWLQAARATPNVRHHGPLPQTQLYRELAQCHALLLPSRFDSFGMVVAEAMAAGTPAIVSEQTGAKMIIERHPGAGWIVQPTADSIMARLKALLEQPLLLQQARPAALAAAAEFTWPAYRQRAGALFDKLFPGQPQ